ncbi:hypothetical protein F7725_001274, partial [Dissostichus mawsoni]
MTFTPPHTVSCVACRLRGVESSIPSGGELQTRLTLRLEEFNSVLSHTRVSFLDPSEGIHQFLIPLLCMSQVRRIKSKTILPERNVKGSGNSNTRDLEKPTLPRNLHTLSYLKGKAQKSPI